MLHNQKGIRSMRFRVRSPNLRVARLRNRSIWVRLMLAAVRAKVSVSSAVSKARHFDPRQSIRKELVK
jgi:hypothetical protein